MQRDLRRLGPLCAGALLMSCGGGSGDGSSRTGVDLSGTWNCDEAIRDSDGSLDSYSYLVAVTHQSSQVQFDAGSALQLVGTLGGDKIDATGWAAVSDGTKVLYELHFLVRSGSQLDGAGQVSTEDRSASADVGMSLTRSEDVATPPRTDPSQPTDPRQPTDPNTGLAESAERACEAAEEYEQKCTDCKEQELEVEITDCSGVCGPMKTYQKECEMLRGR